MSSRPHPLRTTVNGRKRTLRGVPDDERLLDLLRWRLGLRGTKEGCRTGDCGACTVLLDDRTTLSCLTLAHEIEARRVETIEHLARGSPGGKKVAEAFALAGGVQCGYCTPGFVVAVEGWLREREGRAPQGVEQLADELGGNLCRCTGYYGILRSLSRVLNERAREVSEGPARSRFARVATSRSATVGSGSKEEEHP
ncbi:MAG: 2Fe-2S iron-sulfur cluster binding domain-containing protein [Euryarchaeota archaeon]|nr:2Fe-2S iron-sulfur cluster binding domain-containing protein [Euryarchaeota archaeon]MDE1835554.1 2Fe-2S iron-sulfur cluster binding domain-containing protein [Euryarchaeota archaeon]MDE1879645.1 2Fe-2S iron-sulfur cluster binding domain-containing protein [Euryarchaeota archaeon]MDE2043824.1 2Fe-2S iron-sulfur cluster binding domain-containing protein [Thermoplasmata archaeon]